MAKEDVTEKMISSVMKVLGGRGGKAKVPKGTAMLPPEERKERAREAAKARWAKSRAAATKKSGDRKKRG